MKERYYTTVFERRTVTPSEGLNAFLAQLNATNESVRVKKTYSSYQKPNLATKADIMSHLDDYLYLLEMSGLLDESTKEQNTYTFMIPKKSGGYRTIVAPSSGLKQNHQHLLLLLQGRLKVLEHNSAFAYVKNRSTKDSLVQHQKNNSKFFLKVDVEDFFGSCTAELIERKLKMLYPFCLIDTGNFSDNKILPRLASFATLNNSLPQGMPLSPYLTNLIMVEFDYHFTEYCKLNNLVYTRYADDMIISSKEEFSFDKVTDKITKLFLRFDYPFKLKKEKTRYGTRAGRNWNLGLMLNKDNEITVGHLQKKNLKVILFKLISGDLPKNDDTILGLFSYLKQIEPVYYEHLNKYCLRIYNKDIKQIIK